VNAAGWFNRPAARKKATARLASAKAGGLISFSRIFPDSAVQ